MKSLAERHEDRANRKYENASESTAGQITGRVAHAANVMETARAAYAALSEDERKELEAAYEGYDPIEGFKSLAEDDAGNFKYAGIGVVNPLVVPAADQPAPVSLSEVEARAGNGAGGWGDGNINGRAVDKALGAEDAPGASVGTANGWGESTLNPGELPPISKSMKPAELEKIAANEGVDLEGATNNEQRVERIQAKREAGKEVES